MYKNQQFVLHVLLVLISILLVSGCSSNKHNQNSNSSDIIIDTQGVDQWKYADDLKDCREFAEQVPVGQKTAKSSTGGAIVGGAIGAIIGNSDTAAKGAGVGAVTGALKGAKSGYREKRQVVKNCLRGRGYKVLN